MKKILKKFILLFIVIGLLYLPTGCGFVSYERGMSEEAISAQIELSKNKENYIELLQDFSSEDKYREDEIRMYRRLLQEAVNEINECETESEILSAYDTYLKIIAQIKTDEEYIIEELNAYRATAIAEINGYADLSLYREYERNSIKSELDYSQAIINELTDNNAIDEEVRNFKIKVHPYKTDKELYGEELEVIKSETVIAIEKYYNASDYRESERLELDAVKNSFRAQVNGAVDKDSVAELLKLYRAVVDAVKTDAILSEEERREMIEVYIDDLIKTVEQSLLNDEIKTEYKERFDSLKRELLSIKNRVFITRKYLEEKGSLLNELLINGDDGALSLLRENYVALLNVAIDIDEYRVEQRLEIESIISYYSDLLLLASTYDNMLSLYESGINEISLIPDNRKMWQNEDEEFILYMQEKYGNALLELPRSINEANDYFELATIIDWYVFYQLDGYSFERDSFMVKINFDYIDPRTELNTVYWYCELLRSSASIDVEDAGENFLLFKLIPIDFATISNGIKGYETLKSVNTYNGAANQSMRAADYNDFAYYNYTKRVTVWNSQQLWYALEKGCVPICVSGSSAEAVLNRCKEILREICNDDMTYEEKIFSIYSWFGQNVTYDMKYGYYIGSSDIDKYPDENIAKLRSFFPEGSLFDGMAVCGGYAKAYLIMLRLEGIESVLLLGKAKSGEQYNAINLMPYAGYYGTHFFVFIKMSDSKWYYSDVEESNSSGKYIGYYSLSSILLTEKEAFLYYTSYMYKSWSMEMAETRYSIYERLYFQDKPCFVKSPDELKTLVGIYYDYVKDCKDNGEEIKQINIFCEYSENEIADIIYSYDLKFAYNNRYRGFADIVFYC